MARATAALTAAGLATQRWFQVLPDHVAPAVVIGEAAWASPDPARLLRWLGWRADAGGPTTTVWSDPADADGRTSISGPARDLADALLVVAAADARALDAWTTGPLAWLVGDGRQGRAWRSTRSVRIAEGGRWAIAPAPGTQAVMSGPLASGPETVDVEAGEDGAAALADALLRSGIAAPADGLLGGWWEAARTLRAQIPFPYDLDPGHFVVTATGVWQLVPSGRRFRFSLPEGAHAYGSIVRLLADRVLMLGIPPDVALSRSVGDLAVELLGRIGVKVDAGDRALWVETEVDIRLRAAPGPIERDTLRREVGRSADRLVGDHLRAGVLADRRRRTEVERELMTHVAALERDLDEDRTALAELRSLLESARTEPGRRAGWASSPSGSSAATPSAPARWARRQRARLTLARARLTRARARLTRARTRA